MKKRVLAVILALAMIMALGFTGCDNDPPPAKQQYTVTVVNGTGGGTFDEAAEVTVTATVPEGKVFLAWQSDGTVVSTANPYTFKVRSNITLTAVFEDEEPDPGPDKELEELEDEVYYTVADGGTIDGAAGSKQVLSGTEVNISAVVPEFYDFEYWNLNGEKYTEERAFTYKVEANAKFSSVITAVSRYELTLTGCTAESVYQAGTEVVTVTANTVENYEFVNWTINGETVEAPSVYEFELTENTTVVANFRRINISVTAVSDDPLISVTLTSDNDDPDATAFVEGDKITVEAKVFNGIELLAWRTEDGTLLSRDNPYTFEAKEDIKVVAQIGEHYTVTVNGGSFVGSEGKTTDIFGEGAACNVEADLGENELFLNWTDAEGAVLSRANPYMFLVSEDTEITANVKEVGQGTTYTFEAENADLTKLINQNGGNNCVESHENDDHGDPALNQSNKSSNGWIAACFNHTVGNTITWNIRSDSASTAVLILRMGSGVWESETQSKDMTLSPENVDFIVNGQSLIYDPILVEGRTALPNASHLAVYGFMSDYTVAMEIQLKEGVNQIQMVLRALNAGPNIDALKLTTTANLTWTPVQNGGAPIADCDYNVDDVWQGETPETTYIFEAENADLSKNVNQDGNSGWTEWHGGDDHGDPVLNAAHYCSNGYIAAGFNHNVGNTITWRVNSDGAASAILILRMCSGVWESATQSKTCEINPQNVEISVNGTALEYDPVWLEGVTALESASYVAAYGFMEDYTVAYSVPLQEGVNEISMELLQKEAGPNIDALKLRTSASLTWTPVKNGDAPIADYGYNVYESGERPETTYIFEAENADLTKLVNLNGDNNCVENRTADDHGSDELNELHGCSNGWVAACFNHTDGNTITWRINSDGDAAAALILRMCSGVWLGGEVSGECTLTPENFEVKVNGQAVEYEPIKLEGLSGSTSVFSYMNDYTVALEIDLKEGVNEISVVLHCNDQSVGPNMDALKLTTTAGLTWTPVSNNGSPIANYGYNVAAQA